MTTFTVQYNDSGTAAALQQLQQRMGNLRPAMQDIGTELAERIRQQFSRGQDPYGSRWAPLSAVTQAKNKGKRTGGQPLLDTGRLRGSIAAVATANEVSIGTNVAYAGTQQFGARQHQYGPRTPWGNVPARAYMPLVNGQAVLPTAWEQSVKDIITDHLTAGVL